MKTERLNNKFLIAAIVFLAAIITGVWAATASEYTFTNSLNTGSVKVTVEQLQKVDDKTVPCEQLCGEVTPYGHISYIPRITNERARGFVRLKAILKVPGAEPLLLTEKNIKGMGKDWVRIGEYFYSTRPLGTGESSDPFAGIVLPDINNEKQGDIVNVNVLADVIQEENFEPDFSSAAPWGEVAIETEKGEDGIQYGTAERGIIEDATLTYRNGGILEGSTKELFGGIGYQMAGDVHKGTLTIRNTSNRKVRLYFKTSAEESDLLNKTKLRISFMGNTVYEGSLLSRPLGEYSELTTLDRCEEGDFVFETELPSDSLNAFSVLNDQVVWQFKAEEIDKRTGRTVQTGQRIPVVLIIALMVAIISGAFALNILKNTSKGGKEK